MEINKEEIKTREKKPGDFMRIVTLQRPDSDRSVYNLALDVLIKRSSAKNPWPSWSIFGLVIASGKAFLLSFAMQCKK